MTEAELKELLTQPEDVHLEFKEASNRFGEKEINDYCAAISNVAGGYLLLGITDTGEILRTQAF